MNVRWEHEEKKINNENCRLQIIIDQKNNFNWNFMFSFCSHMKFVNKPFKLCSPNLTKLRPPSDVEHEHVLVLQKCSKEFFLKHADLIFKSRWHSYHDLKMCIINNSACFKKWPQEKRRKTNRLNELQML